MLGKSLKEHIGDSVKDAMRSKDKLRLGTLRLAQAAFKQIEIDERRDLDDNDVLAVLDKMLKQRRDSAAQYEEAGREDLADQEKLKWSSSRNLCQPRSPKTSWTGWSARP